MRKRQLADLIDIQCGFAFRSKEYTDDGHFLVRIGNVQDGYVSLGNPRYVELSEKTEGFALKEGDFLTSLTGNIGRVARVENAHLPAALNQRVARLKVRSVSILHPDYFFYFLSSDLFRVKLCEGGHGAAQQNVSPSAIRGLTIPLPSLREQKRIVAILDEAFAGIDRAVANAEKNLANAREIFESHLNAVFTQKGEGWVDRKIAEIAEHSLGKMLDKAKNKGELQPYLRNTNVRWFAFDLSDLLQMPFLPSEADKYTALKGDVLVCEGGYPGRAAIWDQDYPIYLQKALHRVRFHNPAYNRWFVYYLFWQDASGALKQHFSGTGIQHFTGRALACFEIPLPPLSELRSAIDKIDEISGQAQRLESVYQHKLAALAELKQSILYKAFSGEL